MHPGRIEAEEDRRRKAESGGHRKKGGDGDRKYEGRASNETLKASRARLATERPEELNERENQERDETERSELRKTEKLSQTRMEGRREREEVFSRGG